MLGDLVERDDRAVDVVGPDGGQRGAVGVVERGHLCDGGLVRRRHVEHDPAHEERHHRREQAQADQPHGRPQHPARPAAAASRAVARGRTGTVGGWDGAASRGRRRSRRRAVTPARRRGLAGGGTDRTGWRDRLRRVARRRPPAARGVVREQRHTTGGLGAWPRLPDRRRPGRRDGRSRAGHGTTGRHRRRRTAAGCSGPGGYSRWSVNALSGGSRSGGSRKVGVHSATVRRRSRARPVPVSGSPPLPMT